MPDAQLNAIKLAQAVRERMVDFNSSDLFVRDPALAACLRSAWSAEGKAGGLLSDLWVEGAFPPQLSEDTLDLLAAEGVLAPAFKKVLVENQVFPPDQPLYKHQSKSLRAATTGYAKAAKPAITVTAGTGAGKTESFLFPLLNDLFRHEPRDGEGVCAIILYPMNALVNDQVDRLYNWLKGQDQVTLFHFTSETPESYQSANRAGVAKWEPCRFRTRQQARGEETAQGRKTDGERGPVPRILVTNYSMLEYMLCRPQDAGFFGRNLRSLVLDEAHLYTGSLAAEMTLLQRRLLMRCGLTASDVVHYATSATIGTEHLDEFIPKLFSKSKQDVVVIEGEPRRTVLAPAMPPEKTATPEILNALPWPKDGVVQMDKRGDSTLREAPENEWEDWQRCLSALTSADRVRQHAKQARQQPARLLRDALCESPLAHRLESLLWDRRRLSLGALSEILWSTREGEAIEATRRLLQLCASARSTARDYPLIPNRVHFLVRSVQGVTAFFDERPRQRGIPWAGKPITLLPEHRDRCPETQAYGLSLSRCRQCGEVYFRGAEHQGRVRALPPHRDPVKGETLKTFCLPEQVENLPTRGMEVVFNPEQGRFSGHGAEGIALIDLSEQANQAGNATEGRKLGCVNCGADINEEIQPFYSSCSLQRGILAETILAGVPEKAGGDREWLPARGRRLLVFSDSRSSAARLGPSLSRQHAIQVVRSAIVRNAPKEDVETLEFLRESLTSNRARLAATVGPALRARLSEEIRRAEIALSQAESGGSLLDWTSLLKKSETLAEVMDPESALSHRADAWHQTEWKAHGKAMGEKAGLWISREISRRPSWPNLSLESLGLVEVVYPGLEKLSPPDALLGVVTESVRKRLEDVWPQLIASLLDSLRTDGAVTLGEGLEDEDYSDADYQVIGKWASLNESFGSGLIGFIGKTAEHRRSAFVWRVLRAQPRAIDAARPEADLVEKILRAAFDQLRAHSTRQPNGFVWLKGESRESETGNVEAVQIDFSNLALRVPQQLFRCENTGQVWPRAVCNDAPATVGLNLKETTAAELDRDQRIGRMRQELKSSPVFDIGLWGEEHSAQLSPSENRRLQDLFKAGVRNVLSSTTTLELGIDIGGLHAVLMANLPPGKADYLQRAGRAGRRADGSSAVVGFVRPYPYEQEVFHRFDAFLDGQLRRPTVFLDRERIVRRHWHATLLGAFFRRVHPPGMHVGAMRAYGTMGVFCGLPKIPYWPQNGPKPSVIPVQPVEDHVRAAWGASVRPDAGLDQHFIAFLLSEAKAKKNEEWSTVLERLRADCPTDVLAGSPRELLENAAKEFEAAFIIWRKDFQVLLTAWQALDAAKTENRRVANALYYQLNTLGDVTVIETLADLQVLPRYGFPIGLSQLRVTSGKTERRDGPVREEDQFRLERSGLMALREYVPGSRLMAGGRMITSRGLLKHWTGSDVDSGFGLRGTVGQCPGGHRCYSVSKALEGCPVCDQPVTENVSQILLPKHGYTTAAWDKPQFRYDTEVVGKVDRQTLAFKSGSSELREVQNFGGVAQLAARYRQDGEVLVTNSGDARCGFAICTKCGYAESETAKGQGGQGRMQLPKGFERHASLYSEKKDIWCWPQDQAPVLRNQTLAARYSTDVLMLDWSPWLSLNAPNHQEINEALGAALLLSGARILELDARELGVMTDVPAGTGGNGLGTVIYDNTPGGCGHVRELLNQGETWLRKAKELLYRDAQHHASCKHGCLDCILMFGPGSDGATERPDRAGAYCMLEALLKGGTWAQQTVTVPDTRASVGNRAELPTRPRPQELPAPVRVLLAKIDQAKPRSTARVQAELEGLAKNLLAGLVDLAYIPLLKELVQEKLPLPQLGAELAESGETVDLLWERGATLLVLTRRESKPAMSAPSLHVICVEDHDTWHSEALRLIKHLIA